MLIVFSNLKLFKFFKKVFFIKSTSIIHLISSFMHSVRRKKKNVTEKNGNIQMSPPPPPISLQVLALLVRGS
jgi:hypothetical protein